jgi:hypothetical protein
MSGQWPPEWDDPDDIQEQADQQDPEAEAELSAVAAYLASVPPPVMPGTVEARISAALAVEAAARAGLAAPADVSAPADVATPASGGAQAGGPIPWEQAVGARVLRPAPARTRVPGRAVHGPGRQRDVRKVLGRFVVGPLAVCLLIAVIALGLSKAGSSSSSSSSANSLAGVSAAGAAASSAAAAGGNAPPAASAAASAPLTFPMASGTSGGFVVTQSGTRYQQATLSQQARAQVLAAQARESGPTAVPSAASSAVPSAASSAPASASSASSSSSSASTGFGAAVTYAPNAVLRGCVLKVTGGVLPRLVDRATYQGTPAYVIAGASRVWVVGIGCTAASPQVIASVPLAG